ncbi:MAG TPA: lipid A deacylase LpxR family protein [Telluria sp.]
MSSFSHHVSAGLAAALTACCAAATAQETPPPQERVHFLTLENDSRYGTDRFYTNGIQFSTKYATDERGQFARSFTHTLCGWLDCDDSTVLTSQINVGQLMYTPRDITVRGPQPLDRPWGGLLYYEHVYAFLSADQRSLTTLTGQVGVTGRLSLAEPAQKLAHRIFNRKLPEGWDNQIGGTLGILASAERRTAQESLSTHLGHDVQLNTATYWRLTAGNIQTYAAAGVAVVIGKDLPLVSPPPPGIGNKLQNGEQSKLPGYTSCMAPWLQCTAFGSVEARLVAYNVFLDGRPFGDDPSVKRRNFVHDLVLGTRFDFPNTRSASHGPWFLQLKMTRRSPEFRSSIPVPRHRVLAVTIGTEF